jgi:hypothetical protein
LINNDKEMTKTGGRPASIQTNNDFNFSQKQISGLSNAFVSDSVDITDITLIESNENTADLNSAQKGIKRSLLFNANLSGKRQTQLPLTCH